MVVGRGSFIRPFLMDRKRSQTRPGQHERLDGTDAADSENLKPLAPERVKGMSDFHPTQMLTVTMCFYI